MAVAGCGTSDSLLDANEGRVRFVLSGGDVLAPSAAVVSAAPSLSGDGDREENHEGRNGFFESANVTFSSVLARNVSGELLDASMDLPAVVNVVSMEDGREIVLPDAVLPIGTYDQLVVVMKQVQGVTYDGTTVTIDPPGGGWTAIVPVCEFVVGDGETSVVGLKFMVREAFKWRDNRFHFSPRLVCVAEEEVEG